MNGSYERMRDSLTNALNDLSILAGDIMGPSDVTWQDVAGTAAVNLRVLASYIDDVREGRSQVSFPVFPSPAECMERVS